jgi:putative tryptophan/tyrosine transport system substrate-binding protein
VASLARPGGNVTGSSFISPQMRGKQLELLKEAVRGLARVAVLVNPAVPSNPLDRSALQEASRSLNVQLDFVEAPTPADLATAFAAAQRAGAGGLLLLGNPLFFAHRAELARLAAEHRLPTIASFREFAEAGALMTYGPDVRDGYRRAAGYVDKILRGANPGDLPVEQPTKFELTINLKSARALGLELPPALLVRADEVIE